MKRAMLLMFVMFLTLTTAIQIDGREATARDETQDQQISSAKPVIVPYLNKNINEVKENGYGQKQNDYGSARHESETERTAGSTEEALCVGEEVSDLEGGITGSGEEILEIVAAGDDGGTGEDEETGSDNLDSDDPGGEQCDGGSGTGDDGFAEDGCDAPEMGTEDESENNAPECDDESAGGYDGDYEYSGEEYIFIGEWTCTAYCPCSECCGPYSSGYTASGTIATQGRTVACNELPIGTRLLIDGNVYIVEDTGSTPYDQWLDIYFDSHEDALAFGVRVKEVYIIRETE